MEPPPQWAELGVVHVAHHADQSQKSIVVALPIVAFVPQPHQLIVIEYLAY